MAEGVTTNLSSFSLLTNVIIFYSFVRSGANVNTEIILTMTICASEKLGNVKTFNRWASRDQNVLSRHITTTKPTRQMHNNTLTTTHNILLHRHQRSFLFILISHQPEAYQLSTLQWYLYCSIVAVFFSKAFKASLYFLYFCLPDVCSCSCKNKECKCKCVFDVGRIGKCIKHKLQNVCSYRLSSSKLGPFLILV